MPPLTKRELFFLTCLIVLAAALLIPWEYLFGSKIDTIEQKSEEFFASILPQRIINPEPLRFFSQSISSHLTTEGVFAATNEERTKVGLKPLVFNDRLNATAERKIDDMFARQYFAHVSPDGKSAGDLAEESGYDFIIIGENLALGNFKDDAELVKAWMDSPGHKANILNVRYTEIGIAVRKERFEGKNQWLAVQTFGLPGSACKSPDSKLKVDIEADKAEAVELETLLAQKKVAIDKMEPKWGQKYNAAVVEYNALVGEYNTLGAKLKSLITKYNKEVRVYNSCADGS